MRADARAVASEGTLTWVIPHNTTPQPPHPYSRRVLIGAIHGAPRPPQAARNPREPPAAYTKIALVLEKTLPSKYLVTKQDRETLSFFTMSYTDHPTPSQALPSLIRPSSYSNIQNSPIDNALISLTTRPAIRQGSGQSPVVYLQTLQRLGLEVFHRPATTLPKPSLEGFHRPATLPETSLEGFHRPATAPRETSLEDFHRPVHTQRHTAPKRQAQVFKHNSKQFILASTHASDTEPENLDDQPDTEPEHELLDLPYSRQRYYEDLAHTLPPRTTRATPVLHWIPPFPEHRATLRHRASSQYASLDNAQEAARTRLYEAYRLHGQAHHTLWTDFLETQLYAEQAFLQATSFLSLHWPLHKNIIEPRFYLTQPSSLHEQNRLAWRQLSHQDREWLLLHLPTLAMVIGEAQNCTIDLQTYVNLRHSDEAWDKLPTTAPPTPERQEILSQFVHKARATTKNTPAPYHLLKRFLIDNIKMVCLIDTGAASSLVRKSALTLTQQARLKTTEPAPHLLGASGHKLDIFGTLELRVARDGSCVQHTFHVCNDSLPVKILLGYDYLHAHVFACYMDTGRIVMRTDATARRDRRITLQPNDTATHTKPAPPTQNKPKPTTPYQVHLPEATRNIPSGTVVSVFCPIPSLPPTEKGKSFLFEPEESLMSRKGICVIPACQTIQDHAGTLGAYLLVANPSKTDIKHPGRKNPRAALASKLTNKNFDRSDDIIMRPEYQNWFCNAAGLPPHSLTEFTELYGRGQIASHTNMAGGKFWVNPPWQLLSEAMTQIKTQRPAEFFIFGPTAKQTPWITEARSWGLLELTPPQTLGVPGYFLIREFDNTLTSVPFPQHWKLCGFYGTSENIPPQTSTHDQVLMAAHAHQHDNTDTEYLKVNIDEKLSPSQQDTARALAKEFACVFRTNDYPVVKDFQMTIDTEGSPEYTASHRYSPKDIQLENDAVDELLELKAIEPGNGAWAARRVSVRKPDGGMRTCFDYRNLNKKTIADCYKIPFLPDILDHLVGKTYISVSDCYKGFYQIEIAPQDRPKTGFLTRRGLFQFRVMPFGLKNGPAIFQRIMDDTLRGLLWVTCMAYLDDITVHGNDFETAVHNMRTVLQRLKDRNIRLRADKCFWFYKELRLLGHIVSGTHQKPDPKKIEAITKMTLPQTKDQIASFLGLTGWYARFIPDYAKIAAPLFKLKLRTSTFHWGPTELTAWEKLKEALTGPNVMLAQPDPTKTYRIETDASYLAIGGILAQQDTDGEWRPITYMSRRLTPAETNYAPTEIECLAVIYCVEKCRCYVLGTTFELHTDHLSLQWLLKSKAHAGRLARWALRLQEYEYTIHHRPGKLQIVADALSRLPVEHTSSPPSPIEDITDLAGPVFCTVPATNEDVKMCSKQNCKQQTTGSNRFCSHVCRKIDAVNKATSKLKLILTNQPLTEPTAPPTALETVINLPSNEEIRQEQINAPEFKIWWNYIKDSKNPPPGHPQTKQFYLYRSNISLNQHKILVYKLNEDANQQIVIPPSLRPLMLHCFHDLPTAGHFGRQKTLVKLQAYCWWPSIINDVDKYVSACLCRRTTNKNAPTHSAQLKPISPEHPNDIIAGDVAGPFPSSQGYKYILVITCLFSRYTRLFALQSTDAEAAAHALLHGWTLLFGPPRKFLSDQGPQFTAELLQHLCRLLGISKIFTTPYHPQGDGAAERRFKTLNNSVTACHHANLPWPAVLDSIAYAYNNSYNRMIDAVPFLVFLGRIPKGLSNLQQDDGEGTTITQNARAYGYQAYIRLLQETQTTHKVVSAAQEKMAADHNKQVKELKHPYRTHDLVWLFTPRLLPDTATPEERSSRKLANYWGTHPWIITTTHTNHTATIKDIHGMTQRVHFNRLKPFTSPLMGTTTLSHDGRPVVIHHIISDHRQNRTLTYKVRWFPFNLKQDSLVAQADVPIRFVLEWENRMKQTHDDTDIACEICTSRANASDMLLCDGCDKGYHNPCVGRTPGDIPTGDWYCTTCTPFVANASSLSVTPSAKGGGM